MEGQLGAFIRDFPTEPSKKCGLKWYGETFKIDLLFALVSLRGVYPGRLPRGAGIDILMYFWVVAVVTVSLGFVTGLLLARAKKPSESTSD